MKQLHKILILLNTISVLFLLQIVFELLPAISCNYSIERIEKINSFIVDLSIGVITSSFFYYLLVYIPEKRRQKVVRAMIQRHLIRISNDMINIVAYLANIYSVNSKSNLYDDIPIKTFDGIFKEIDIIEPKAYVHQLLDGAKFKSVENLSLESIYYGRFDSLKNDINKILAIPSIIYEDTELIKILANIKECGLFHILPADFKLAKEWELQRKTRHLFEADKFYTYYLALLKYIKPSPILLRKATKEDIEEYFKEINYKPD